MGSQLFFFSLFVALIYLNRLQLWILVFSIGVVVSIGFSRFYCGWTCPITTLSRPFIWFTDKFSIKRLNVPKKLQSMKIRLAILILFLGVMITLRRLTIDFPVLLLIALIGVAFMSVFDEELFHKYLCPYGVILSFASKHAVYRLAIDPEECVACGKCQDVCPNNTIDTLNSGKRSIAKKECLHCFKCQEVCPGQCIDYKK